VAAVRASSRARAIAGCGEKIASPPTVQGELERTELRSSKRNSATRPGDRLHVRRASGLARKSEASARALRRPVLADHDHPVCGSPRAACDDVAAVPRIPPAQVDEAEVNAATTPPPAHQ